MQALWARQTTSTICLMSFSGNIFKFHNKGNKHIVFIAFVVFVLLSSFNASAIDTPANRSDSVLVGVVNVTFLMENAPQAEVASNKLKSKFLPQEKSLAKSLEVIQQLEADLEKSSRNLSVSQKRQKERELRAKKRSRSRALQDFREELRFARDSALDDVQKEVFQAIDTVRELKGIDIILQDYVAASKRVDITSSVLTHLKEKLAKQQEAEVEVSK